MSSDVVLFIDPFSYHFLKDGLFDAGLVKGYGDNTQAPWVYLREWFAAHGIRVHTVDRFLEGQVRGKTNVCISFGRQQSYPALARRKDIILSAFFAFESPVVEPHLYEGLAGVQRCFKRIFTFTDERSIKPFLRAPLQSQIFQIPYFHNSIVPDLWARRDRRFLVIINRNSLPAVYWRELYTERMRAVEFFGRTGEIDLYGSGWNGPSFRMGKTWLPGTLRKWRHRLLTHWQRLYPDPLLVSARRVYRGPVESKLEALSEYNFNLCFENVVLNGWITEKIFDCFIVGTVPIYWGAPDVDKYIPTGCFIDVRQFSGYPELKRFLRSLTEKEIQSYRDSGREFLNSARFRPFTKEFFTEVVARIVEEDAGIQLCRG